MEAKYKLTRNDPSFDPDVSEQNICWEQYMGSTGGGWGTAVFDYFRTHGVVSEAECPYQPSSPDVGVAPYWPLNTGWQNRVWKSISNLNDFTNNTTTMKAYLKTCGPLEVGLWAGHDLYTSVADMIANYRARVRMASIMKCRWLVTSMTTLFRTGYRRTIGSSRIAGVREQ